MAIVGKRQLRRACSRRKNQRRLHESLPHGRVKTPTAPRLAGEGHPELLRAHAAAFFPGTRLLPGSETKIFQAQRFPGSVASRKLSKQGGSAGGGCRAVPAGARPKSFQGTASPRSLVGRTRAVTSKTRLGRRFAQCNSVMTNAIWEVPPLEAPVCPLP